MSDNVVRGLWEAYEARAVLPQSPAEWREIHHQAFYSGAWAMFLAIIKRLDSDETNAERLSFFTALDEELQAHAASERRNRRS